MTLDTKAIRINHTCLECGFTSEVATQGRKVTCPTCGTTNDFWLEGEQPPHNHADHKAIREALHDITRIWSTSELLKIVRQLLDENATLTQRIKDYEGCKGVEDYYRVLCDLREVKAENERLRKERDHYKASADQCWTASTLSLSREIEQLKAENERLKMLRQISIDERDEFIAICEHLKAAKEAAIVALEKIRTIENSETQCSIADEALEQLKRE